MMRRREALAWTAGAVLGSVGAIRSAHAQAANQWFAVAGDDGHPVPNLRVPIELAEEIEDLPGAVWGGPASAAATLVEFYDYNCPWCRAAAKDVSALMAGKDLRVGLVNNPILSPGSAQAAKVELALLKLKGAAAAHLLSTRLLALTGRTDGIRALETAVVLGFDRAEIERVADGPEVGATLRRQMRLAADLGLVATPSYVTGGAALLGYPGPKALARVVGNVRTCGTISC